MDGCAWYIPSLPCSSNYLRSIKSWSTHPTDFKHVYHLRSKEQSTWKGYSKSLKVEKKTAYNREIIKKPLMKHPWTINTKPVPGPTKVRMMLDDFSPLVACIFSRIGHLKRIGFVPQFQVVNLTVLFDFNLHGTHIPSPIFKDTDQVCSALKAKHESFAMSMYIDSWIQIVRVQDSWRLHFSYLTRTQFETSLQSSTCWSTILNTRKILAT